MASIKLHFIYLYTINHMWESSFLSSLILRRSNICLYWNHWCDIANIHLPKIISFYHQRGRASRFYSHNSHIMVAATKYLWPILLHFFKLVYGLKIDDLFIPYSGSRKGKWQGRGYEGCSTIELNFCRWLSQKSCLELFICSHDMPLDWA